MDRFEIRFPCLCSFFRIQYGTTILNDCHNPSYCGSMSIFSIDELYGHVGTEWCTGHMVFSLERVVLFGKLTASPKLNSSTRSPPPSEPSSISSSTHITMHVPSLWACLVTFFVTSISATSLTYKMQANERDCFFAQVTTSGAKVAFYFAVRPCFKAVMMKLIAHYDRSNPAVPSTSITKSSGPTNTRS